MSEGKEPKETRSEAKQAVTYKYAGDGDHFIGVPARDLTKEDFEALSDEQKEAVKKSGTYTR